MTSLSANKVAGLALMAGIVLWAVAGVVTPGAISSDSIEQGEFFRKQLEPWIENAGLTHVLTMAVIVSVVMQAFGVYYLLRLPRRAGVADMALRFSVLASIGAWIIVIITMGLRHMIVHTLTHGIEPAMSEADRLDFGLGLYAAYIGISFGYLALSGIARFILGIALAARFSESKLVSVAGYLITATGIGMLINLILIEHFHNVDFSLLVTISSFLEAFGVMALLLVGYSIFRGHGELGQDSQSI